MNVKSFMPLSKGGKPKARFRRVDIQVCILTACIVIVSCSIVFAFTYSLTYRSMLDDLIKRTVSIHEYLDDTLDKDAFVNISVRNDMSKSSYEDMHGLLSRVKDSTGVMYLYTATQNAKGEYIYLIDGLPLSASDFRYPGDLIEPEIIPDIERAMDGELVLPNRIKSTEWGKIFISYLPIHNEDSSEVVGVIGIEFLAEEQYYTYSLIRIVTPLVMLLSCLICTFIAFKVFKRISNPTYKDLANTDSLTGLKNRSSYDTDLKNIENSSIIKDIGFISIDLNNLKLVNDHLGHAAGDEYISCVAASLAKANTGNHAIYRIGGDEFVVLTNSSTVSEMCDFIDQASRHFEKTRPNWDIPISFSAGAALYDCKLDSDWHDTFSRADRNMYTQKKEFHNEYRKHNE